MNPFARSHAFVDQDPDNPGDLIALLPARRFRLGPSRKKPIVQAEQMGSFVAAWCEKHGVPPGKVNTNPRDDENDHDFDMTVHGTTYEVELTALLSVKLRSERRRNFAVGQAVHDAIAADAALTSALAGYDVLLRDEASTPMPTNRKTIAATAHAIVGHLMTGTPGPVAAQASRMHIKTHDGIGVLFMTADPATMAGGAVVHASTSNTSTTLNATRTAVNDALLEKDKKSRKYVVIVAGDPSNENLTLPVETAEYELIAHAGAAPVPPLTHVEEAWLHLAGTHELIRLV